MSVATPTSAAAVLPVLGALLDYPGRDTLAKALACREALAGLSAEAAAEAGAFLEWALNARLETLEECYTRAFDVAPQCVPYVSVHLFGDESFKRGELMARLREAYALAGFDPGPELPDHLGTLLRFAQGLDGDDLEELVRYCLVEPVGKIAAQLERARSPYAHAVRAVDRFLFSAFGLGGPA